MAFFKDDAYFTGPPITDELVSAAEESLGVRLPSSYIDLLKERNGGVPILRCIRTEAPTSWAPDHIEITAIRGVSGEWGIDAEGGPGSRYLIQEWDYPDIGVVLCQMPSGGHDAVMLDYSRCGPRGEPSVAYIDEDRSVQSIARSFAEFRQRLEPCENFKR
jgi:hypothetical protein